MEVDCIQPTSDCCNSPMHLVVYNWTLSETETCSSMGCREHPEEIGDTPNLLNVC